MGRFWDIVTGMLLVIFVTGGVFGPSVHRVHHAVEKLSEASCHPDWVHEADLPTWTDAGQDVRALHCALCVTRILVVLPTIESVQVPTVLGTPPVEPKSSLASVHIFTDHTIRGPPRLSS